MTSRTTSWSSTTSTVSCMRPVSPKDSPFAIPGTGFGPLSSAVHTAFLLMRRLHRRPVRRDRGIAEVAVRDAVPREELPVGPEELVDAPVRGYGGPPREPGGLPEGGERRGTGRLPGGGVRDGLDADRLRAVAVRQRVVQLDRQQPADGDGGDEQPERPGEACEAEDACEHEGEERRDRRDHVPVEEERRV